MFAQAALYLILRTEFQGSHARHEKRTRFKFGVSRGDLVTFSSSVVHYIYISMHKDNGRYLDSDRRGWNTNTIVDSNKHRYKTLKCPLSPFFTWLSYYEFTRRVSVNHFHPYLTRCLKHSSPTNLVHGM